jgi:hypothetical protein
LRSIKKISFFFHGGDAQYYLSKSPRDCCITRCNVNEDRAHALLDAASDLCIVSKAEDKRLSDAKLKTSMPEPWSLDIGCRWARYDHEK